MNLIPLASVTDSFSGAFDFIFHSREAVGGGVQVGGLGQVWEYMGTQIWVSAIAVAIAILIALPVGLYFGHRGTGELLAVAIGNAGRALPELLLIALMLAFVGVGVLNLTIALTIVGVPPILTNAFVGMRQVDPEAVEAARGMGFTEPQVITRVELPLAVPTVMAGIRTAAVNIIATATIGPLIGVVTLGDFIINYNVYGNDGLIAGAILVALLALVVDLLLAGLQHLLTPRGLELQRKASRATA
jgi:osmoprotectant transport system permease protein